MLAGVYQYPGQKISFEELYAHVDPETVNSLAEFRDIYPLETVDVGGVEWTYLSLREGPETILFLHGMTGAYDIWW
jgi:hypothetical protein